MVKTITRIGNSRGLISDSALLQLAHLQEGNRVNVEVHPGGTITITPLARERIDANEAGATAARIISENSELFERLS